MSNIAWQDFVGESLLITPHGIASVRQNGDGEWIPTVSSNGVPIFTGKAKTIKWWAKDDAAKALTESLGKYADAIRELIQDEDKKEPTS